MEKSFSSRAEYLEYPFKRLFKPLGAKSFVMGIDWAGHFVGSSFSFATARDWAKLGQLVLQHGHWRGSQLLPRHFIENEVFKPTNISGGICESLCWCGRRGWIEEGKGRREIGIALDRDEHLSYNDTTSLPKDSGGWWHPPPLNPVNLSQVSLIQISHTTLSFNSLHSSIIALRMKSLALSFISPISLIWMLHRHQRRLHWVFAASF